MSELKNFITSLHQSSKRDYLERMNDEKIECMIEAKKYEENYWDGNRRYGYGGYKYIKDRWKPLAENLIRNYNLSATSKVLDVGCGKGYLLFEIKKLIPDIKIFGLDNSDYGIKNSHNEVKPYITKHRAQDKFPYSNNEFDLVISITTLHNLRIFDLEKSLKEIERVGKNGYLVVESYRNENELFNLECWALTCESFFDVDEWIWLFKQFGYHGDYEFIFFE